LEVMVKYLAVFPTADDQTPCFHLGEEECTPYNFI